MSICLLNELSESICCLVEVGQTESTGELGLIHSQEAAVNQSSLPDHPNFNLSINKYQSSKEMFGAMERNNTLQAQDGWLRNILLMRKMKK